jgi:hypothetical protein
MRSDVTAKRITRVLICFAGMIVLSRFDDALA